MGKRKITWVSTNTTLTRWPSRAEAVAQAPEGARLHNHDDDAGAPAQRAIAVIRNGKAVP